MAKRKQSKEQVRITKGSDNVFRDLGLKNANELLVKADLVIAIFHAMKSCNMTQAKLAALAGIDQPAVSKLLRGHVEGFSTDRLMSILNRLGQDIEITVHPKFGKRPIGRVKVLRKSLAGSVQVVSALTAAFSGRVAEESRVKYTARSHKKK